MDSPNFLNPFHTPLFTQLIVRLGIVYGIAGLAIALLYFKRPRSQFLRSNIVQRYIGWLLLTPIYLVGVFCGRIPGLVVAMLFLCGGIIEYTRISGLSKTYRAWMIILAGVSLLIASYGTQYFYSLPLLYFLVFTALAIRQNNPKTSFSSAAYAMYGAIWLLFSLSHIVLLTKFNNGLDTTHILPFLTIFAVACADVGGYVFGKLFHAINFLDDFKVAKDLSPNKTYIGTLGYIIGAGGAIWLLHFGLATYLDAWQWAVIAVIIGAFSFIGGLTHSYFKRYFGVKDSGTLIPGHGGVIDRLDSLARVVVVLYYFLVIFI